jgi:hypothetical protein
MKITTKNTQSEKPVDVRLEDLWPGIVFEFKNGCIAVKGGYDPDDSFLLTDMIGNSYFARVDSYKTEPIKRILGLLVEIVVKPM